MANHTNVVHVIRYGTDEYITGDAFWPQVTNDIKKATRIDNFNDAKKYVKTAKPRLKKSGNNEDVSIIKAVAERNENFELVKIRILKEQ